MDHFWATKVNSSSKGHLRLLAELKVGGIAQVEIDEDIFVEVLTEHDVSWLDIVVDDTKEVHYRKAFLQLLLVLFIKGSILESKAFFHSKLNAVVVDEQIEKGLHVAVRSKAQGRPNFGNEYLFND